MRNPQHGSDFPNWQKAFTNVSVWCAVVAVYVIVFGTQQDVFVSSLPPESKVPNAWTKVTFRNNPPQDTSITCRKPAPRSGHSSVIHGTSMYMFGGMGANEVFYNDVWEYKLEAGALDCEWFELVPNDNISVWFSAKDARPATPNRRGIVPARPSGRVGHSAAMADVRLESGAVRTFMTIYGGFSPNCSNYCYDIWHMDLASGLWTILYGEWWEPDGSWGKMLDYSTFNDIMIPNRWRHDAVVYQDRLYVIGGHTLTDSSKCCGYTCPSLQSPIVQPNCGYLADVWSTLLKEYIPFQTQIAIGKHAVQSSTVGFGFASVAVDGIKSGTESNRTLSMTNVEPQAWWQVSLGGVTFISNMTIWNRADHSQERLNNFYVLTSTQPFSSDRLQDLLSDPLVWKYHVMYAVEEATTLFPEQSASFIRIQLAGTNSLALSEVEVWGFPPIQAWQHFEGPRRWTMHVSGFERNSGIDAPRGRMGHKVVLDSNTGSVYTFGGYVKESPSYIQEFWKLDLSTTKFTSVAPHAELPQGTLPSGRYGHNMVLSEEMVVIFGGQAGYSFLNNVYSSGFRNDMWMWNTSSSAVGQVKMSVDPLYGQPIPRQDASMVEYKDLLIIFGGLADVQEHGTSTDCPGGFCGDMWMFRIDGINSCPNACSGKGTCRFARCECFDQFYGDDCSLIRCPNSVCSQDYLNRKLDCQFCNGHGTCDGKTGTCTCGAGWIGESCSIKHCPNDCSFHGACLDGGICDCDEGFGGTDCSTAFCPNNCSSKGECLVESQGIKVTTTCICGDIYTGADCGSELADELIAEATEAALGAAGNLQFDATILLLPFFLLGIQFLELNFA